MAECKFISIRSNAKDLTGQVFSRLTALGPVERHPTTKGLKWLCQCSCGNQVVVFATNLTGGITTSCGCYRSERQRADKTKHGLKDTPEYTTWRGIRRRCNNPNEKSWPLYGGRGIGIDPSWDDFTRFLKDMGKKPTTNHSIGRIDNDKGYSPENCRWETPEQQANNTSRNRFITYNGETKTLGQWSSVTGINRGTINSRLLRGWSVEDALTKPLRPMKCRP